MVRHPSFRRALRYGLNPYQTDAQLISPRASWPLDVLSGTPGFINLLDALRGWSPVRELRRRFNRPSAASFKHVNPAGVALGGGDLPEGFMATHFFGDLAVIAFSDGLSSGAPKRSHFLLWGLRRAE